jgi:glucosyl-3-phosphoglycerate synthase
MSLTPETWLSRHTMLSQIDAPRRVTKAAADGTKMGVVLWTRDNAATIGRHLLLLQHGWPGGKAPWSEVVVADLGSSDSTAQIARDHGATVLEIATDAPRTQAVADGDGLARVLEWTNSAILLVAPANLVRLEFVGLASLMAAMLDHPACRLATGAESPAGGLLSRLSIRPLLAAVCPPLAVLSDPTSPLFALRPDRVRDLPLARTDGFEAALLVDCWNKHGLESIVQVLVGELDWADGDPRQNPTHAFHCQLAVLEALRRAGRIQPKSEFGHILPTPEAWDENGSRVVSRLEVFPWKSTSSAGSATSLNLSKWFEEKL